MDYYERVKLKEQEQSELTKRMKTDYDLLNLRKYILSDKAGKAVPDIINVTLNKPAVYAANIISSLGSTSQQTVVESSNAKIDTHYIEDFQDAALNAANNRLQRRGLSSLNAHADVQLCVRGRAARRILFRLGDNGQIIPDIIPWDTRFVSYERGETGLKWAAYHIDRNWAATEEQYGELMIQYGVYKDGEKREKANILDVWTEDHNEIWVEGKEILEQPHDFGFCPVCLEVVSLGYGNVLMEEDRLQHEGESIFMMVRDIIPELNRLVSILQTLNQKLVLAPQKYKSDDITSEPPDYPKSGDVVNVGQGDLLPIDYGDAKQAAQMVYNILEKAMQQGSVSDIDLGNLNFPLSAVALVTVGEGRDQIYLPRLNAKATLNQHTAEMFTKQILQIGGTVELGTPGHKESFNTSKLDGEYETTYKYYVKSPKVDIARLTMGSEALKLGVDRETVYTDILQYEDPKGMIQKYYYELAEKLSPNVLMNRTILKLLEMAEDDGNEEAAIDAQLMAQEIGASLDQVKAGVATPSATPEPQGKPMLPLLGKGNRVGGVKPTPAEFGGQNG